MDQCYLSLSFSDLNWFIRQLLILCYLIGRVWMWTWSICCSSMRWLLKIWRHLCIQVPQLIWQTGGYSVKPAYRFCIDELIGTNLLKVLGSWNLVWKLRVPLKVKKSRLENLPWLPSHMITSSYARSWLSRCLCYARTFIIYFLFMPVAIICGDNNHIICSM